VQILLNPKQRPAVRVLSESRFSQHEFGRARHMAIHTWLSQRRDSSLVWESESRTDYIPINTLVINYLLSPSVIHCTTYCTGGLCVPQRFRLLGTAWTHGEFSGLADVFYGTVWNYSKKYGQVKKYLGEGVYLTVHKTKHIV